MGFSLIARILAFVVAGVAIQALPSIDFVSILIAFTFSHYAMALLYSYGPLRDRMSRPELTGKIALLGFAIVLCATLDQPAMLAVFGFHHVCNEMAQNARTQGLLGASRWSLLAQATFETMAYVCIVFPDLEMVGISPVPLLRSALTIGLLVAFGGVLWASGGSDGRGSRVRLGLPSMVTAAFSLWCLTSKIGGLDLALYYHFFYWMIAPLQKRWAEGWGATGFYLLATVATFAVVLPFTPSFVHLGGLSLDTLSRLSRIGGYFHIISSFATSSAHPLFIRRFFAIERPSVAVITKSAA